MLQDPDPADWLNWRRTLDGWGYSPLEQIDRSNVDALRLAWSWGLEPGVSQTTPIVHAGVMYVANPGNVVQALDARTGDFLWEYRREMDERRRSAAQMRSLAVYQDLVILNTFDAHVVGLDVRTGEARWDTPVGGGQEGYTFSNGPIVVDGTIIAGMTGCGRYRDDTCYIVGVDGRTGRLLWRTSTIARPGESGGDTWGDLPLLFRAGSDAWMTGSYDPVTRLIYWGTSQPKPHNRDARGTDGDALYSNSTLVLDPATGEMKWYYQHIPGDSHDMDESFERILIDYDGKRSLFTMGKLGILWELDRVTGAFRRAIDLGYQNILDVDSADRSGDSSRRDAVRRRRRALLLPQHGWFQEPAGDGVSPRDRGAVRAAQSELRDRRLRSRRAARRGRRRGRRARPEESLSSAGAGPTGRVPGAGPADRRDPLAPASPGALQHVGPDDRRRPGLHRRLGAARLRLRRAER